MAVPLAAGKGKGPIVDPALCRCCRSIKKCRLLSTEYEWMGQKEVYSEILMDCFGLLLSNLDGDSKESCICATCVVRLRDAYAFRQQVLQSEEVFLNAKLENKDVDDTSKLDAEVKTEFIEADTMDDRDELLDITDIDDDIKLADIKGMKLKSDYKKISKKTRKSRIPGKNDLLNKMMKYREQLKGLIETPVILQKKEKKRRPSLDHDTKLYMNAVTIVTNSYVCPFHNRISIYYCYYCRDQFTNPTELREHTLTHNPQKLFETMMENKKIPKIDITRIDCRLCEARIDDIDSFKLHITSVHGKSLHPVNNEFLKFKLTLENLACTECGNVFPYFDALKKHMIDHFGTSICDICGACFLEPNSLRTHIKKHSKVDMNYPCEICGKNLKSKYSRYLHVATVHEKKPTVNCYKCEASFLSYAQRNKHLIEVHADKRTFACQSCDKVYNRRKTLMEHNRRIHLKVYRHQCDLCDQRFYLPSRLKEHMATHTGERNFRCEFCDKSYPRLQSLQEHIRSHSNERRYKCDLCNSAFTQNGSLKNHMKSHHQGYDLDASFG